MTDKETPADKAKREAAEKAALADDTSDGETEHVAKSESKKDAAATNLRRIAQSYPLTTPDEHTIFGFGGFKFTLGELRALFDMQSGR